MPAKFIPVGEPAHDAERQALRFLVDNLADEYVVYGNPWLVEPSGSVFELDAVVVAPHALYVVEIKSYRGSISGNDNDWYLPQPIRSPLKLNRKTAQVLASVLKRRSVDAGRPFVEGFVFLSHASDCRVVGPASVDRVHTRRSICTAIQDPAPLWRREGRRPPVDDHGARVVHELLVGADPTHKPPRFIREWKLEAPVDRTDRYVEYFATHNITRNHAVLRVYDVSMLDDDATRKRNQDLFQWEAQVLCRIGALPNILHASNPSVEEAGYMLPFEAFSGVTLGTWLEHHGSQPAAPGRTAPKVELWKRIAEALDAVHGQGVVHRLLRPEVILVEDIADKPEIRVTGFELAKQLYLSGQTVAISTLNDDRRRWSAPEVVRSFSDADARSDQFSLGALLGHILVGRSLFDSTEELIRRNGAFTRLRDVNPALRQLDEAVATMLSLAGANRFPSLTAAIEAVDRAVSGRASTTAPTLLNPEDIPAGTRLGTDYEVIGQLGAGGMATVYLARHLMSGTTRALKVSRSAQGAEDALMAEHEALKPLDHPNIVKAIDITGVVPGRRTLVLERVRGTTLAKRLATGALTDEERRVYAENLLSALGYLEQKGVVHKDIKPDNLIVSGDALTVIDFSLAGKEPKETAIGTALYRDPTLDRWSAVSDRYAAALCLFEMYVGRHAFGGRAPSPEDVLAIDQQEIDRPKLAEFFVKALSPYPTQRPPSALAMRALLHEALGSKSVASVPPSSPATGLRAGDAPLSATAMSGTALSCLRRAGITTQGALVLLDEAKISGLPGLGTKKREEVLSLRQSLIDSGVVAEGRQTAERHPLHPSLIGDPRDVHALTVPGALAETLSRAGFSTVGRLADATRHDLQKKIPTVGAKTIAQVVQALQRMEQVSRGADVPVSLDGLWELATKPLVGQQLTVLEGLFGIRDGRDVTPGELAATLGTSQPNISHLKQRAIDVLDRRVLDEVIDHVEGLLVAAGGILRIDDAGARVLERWPVATEFSERGFLRFLAEVGSTRFACHDVLDDGARGVLARRTFDEPALKAFLQAARTLAAWPPKQSDGVVQSLRAYLPEYEFDPVGLATRLSHDLRLTTEGELYEAPVSLSHAAAHLLRKARLPIPLEQLRASLLANFGDALDPPPDLPELGVQVVRLGTYQLDATTGTVGLPASRSVDAKPEVSADPLPVDLRLQDPAELAARVLRGLADRDGFRLVVAAPEHHPEIARSLVRCLGEGARYLSFEDELFRRADATIDALERAERFLAQKPKLKREAEWLLDTLVKEHGRPGARIVLGETALWGICDALHLVRRLYDLTSTGGRGFWTLVVPGLVSQSQPLFNEKRGALVFSMEGAVLSLTKPVSASVSL